jgi:chaperonin GroEL
LNAALRCAPAIRTSSGGASAPTTFFGSRAIDSATVAALALQPVAYRPRSENAGYDGGVIVAEIERRGQGVGFDAATGEYENLMDVVPDPTKVTRYALQNAASIASMLLTTETLTSDIPEKEKAGAAPPMPDY